MGRQGSSRGMYGKDAASYVAAASNRSNSSRNSYVHGSAQQGRRSSAPPPASLPLTTQNPTYNDSLEYPRTPPVPFDPIRAAGNLATLNPLMPMPPMGLEEFMPEALPTTPNLPPRPQRPGAYRGSSTSGANGNQMQLERTHSLYKGGMHVLGREALHASAEDSTRYFNTTQDESNWNSSRRNNGTTPNRSNRTMNSARKLRNGTSNRINRSGNSFSAARNYSRGLDSSSDVESPGVAVPSPTLHTFKEEDSKRKWLVWVGIGVLLLIGTLTGVIVGVVLAKEKNDPNSSSPQSSSFPTTEPLQWLGILQTVLGGNATTALPSETFQAIAGIGNSNSDDDNYMNPQRQALQWLVQDPNLSNYSLLQKQQRFALASFYYASNGPHWYGEDGWNQIDTPWLDYHTHECEWYSLAITQQQEQCYSYRSVLGQFQHADFRSLVLSGDEQYTRNNTFLNPALQGTLVPELMLLNGLESLDVGHQKLKGHIPTALTKISLSLRRIILEDNSFSGIVPEGLWEFPRVLRLNQNSRLDAGTIPTSLGLNPRITHLGLVNTNRNGTIPTELFRATTLQQLLLDSNQLKGSIPTQLGLLERLVEFRANNNQFSSTIPTQIGNLDQLITLTVGGNFLTGPLPTQLGNLDRRLLLLEVTGNQLSGTIPVELGSLKILQTLKLEDNNFSGQLPKELSNLREMRVFLAKHNDLVGPLHQQLLADATSQAASWPNLVALDLSDNGITSTIPSEIGLLAPSIKMLLLERNQLTGALPSELGLLTSLQNLELGENQFSSPVPVEVCALPVLEQSGGLQCEEAP